MGDMDISKSMEAAVLLDLVFCHRRFVIVDFHGGLVGREE